MFHRVCLSSELLPGGRLVWTVQEIEILLLRTATGLRAVNNRCPHRGGLFSEGELVGEHIFCPLHAWCFDLMTGEAFFPRGAFVRVFPVRESCGWIEVEVPE